MKKIFVMDDEADVLVTTKLWGKKKGYEVSTFLNSEGFLDSLLKVKPDIIFIDINLKGDDGRFVSQDLKNILPFAVKIILISGDPEALLSYHNHYADDILNKPFTFEEFEKKLLQHLPKN